MQLSLRQFEIFLSVARTGNVSRSAEELLLSQSAVSMALQEMERLLGGSLFDRPGKKLHLNERGRLLLPRALEILDRVEEAGRILRGSGKSVSGSLRIAASSTIGNYLIPAKMAEFVNTYPEVRLSLEVGNSVEVVKRILAFEADTGFVEGNARDVLLHSELWRKDSLVVFAAPHHPLARKRKLQPEDLERKDWILREKGSGTRESFENAVRDKFLLNAPLLELGNTEAIKAAVETGSGISCISRLALERSFRSGHLVELKTPFLSLERELYVITHRDKYRSRLLSALLSFCGRK